MVTMERDSTHDRQLLVRYSRGRPMNQFLSYTNCSITIMLMKILISKMTWSMSSKDCSSYSMMDFTNKS